MIPAELKKEILRLTRDYARRVHAASLPGEDRLDTFVPGETNIPYAARTFSADEVCSAVSSVLDFWLTLGKEGQAMERQFADLLGVRRSLLVNSGSSANLLAISALTSHKLPKEKRLERGDEVITCAAGFPTTVAPIVQNGAVPVFIDNDPLTANADLTELDEAYVPGKTKAVILAHALGNPFDLSRIKLFCREHDLWLIEDNCDALGSLYSMNDETRIELGESSSWRTGNGSPTGAFGDISTQSFYPPHHLTMGEGGAVNIVRDPHLKVIVESLRDWGRDCWCPSGKDNSCNKRFGWKLGEMPEGYDHKYIYSHLGYNLKPLDIQAAIGLEQLKKLDGFTLARKKNWNRLRSGLADLEEYFDFSLPTHATAWNPDGFEWDESGHRCYPSWFGFQMLVKPDAPFTRTEVACHLNEKKIGTRMFFGGNLVRQPAFVELQKNAPSSFRVVGSLEGADRIMNTALFLGVYPGLTNQQIDFMIDTVKRFTQKF
jgi:CDP-4-dehydro-6-deoxyglucose reductase, E1